MIPPEFPENESERQLAVEKYQLLDTLPEELYDNITALMAYICETPISLITLMDKDRNFLKSHHGVDLIESPRNISFCGHALISDEVITIIEDARKDIRFHDNPLVTEFSAYFYAGVPLVDPDGYKLGTLCVYDNRPRKLTEEQKMALVMMARQVTALMVSNYENYKLRTLKRALEDKNATLSKFAHIVSHDLKSPLNSIISLTDIIEMGDQSTLNNESIACLSHLKNSAHTMKTYIDGMLAYYDHDKLLKEDPAAVETRQLLNEVIKLVNPPENTTITYESAVDILRANRSALMHILLNLLTNGLKYNHKDECIIHVNVKENASHYLFEVSDNGDGISAELQERIFEIFTIGVARDRFGLKGNGIGLASVRKFVETFGGEISVSSVPGEGSVFTFSIKK